MPGFTPGPWGFSNGDLIRVTTTRGKRPLVVCGVHRIGKYGGLAVGDPIANARLISAAPDMLASLKEAEIAVEQLCFGQDPANQCWVTLGQIRAAIAKAEGE